MLFEISAATKKGTRELMAFVYGCLQELPIPEQTVYEDVPLEEEFDDSFTVTVEDDVYCVEGGRADYIVAHTNFSDYESLQFFQRCLRDSGIIDELEKAGINEGDTVRIGDLEFDYVK